MPTNKKQAAQFEIDLSAPGLEEKIAPPVFNFNEEERNKKSKNKKEEKKDSLRAPKADKKSGAGLQINLYRKIAFSFIFLTLALLAVIFYFSFVKVTIIITPADERVGNNLLVDIYDKNKQSENASLNKGAVSGAVEQIEVEETKIYESSGADIIGEEVIGKVTIINDYNKNQPLVATTRLLSADGKLFRIKNTVNAPAGGSVEVEVYADRPSADMAIGPAKFTIPGLWAGLQDKVYAESKEEMRYQQKTKKHILQSDIDAGLVDLKKALLSTAESAVNDKYKDYSQKLYKINDDSVSNIVGAKAGEEKDDFSITMKTNVAAVAFQNEQIAKMAEEKLASSLAAGKELIGFDKNAISYNLDNFNLTEGMAAISASFEGKMVLNDSSSIIDREKILGLSRQQLNDYLANLPGVSSYEVKFSPSFIDKVPNLADRVEVKIKNKK